MDHFSSHSPLSLFPSLRCIVYNRGFCEFRNCTEDDVDDVDDAPELFTAKDAAEEEEEEEEEDVENRSAAKETASLTHSY